MSIVRFIFAAASTAIAAAPAQAQFVKGNEAVRVLPNGAKTVETPPLPSIQLAAPCKAEIPACAVAGWMMVETHEGLRECTEFYARPGSCTTSTYGSEKRPRRWILKISGRWMQCQGPDIASKCVSTKALPPAINIQ